VVYPLIFFEKWKNHLFILESRTTQKFDPPKIGESNGKEIQDDMNGLKNSRLFPVSDDTGNKLIAC